MKTRNLAWIIICLLTLALSACQSDQFPEEVCPIDETTGEYDERCAPTSSELEAQDAYPLDDNFIPTLELAYPITEEDLTLLLREWRLTIYAEDGNPSNPSYKNLTFNADGSYNITTETELEQGTWTAFLRAVESTLILDPGTGITVRYQIIDLEENILNLRTWRGNIQIDEEYLPTDST